MKKLLLIAILLVGCNTVESENKTYCAQSTYIEKGFYIETGKFKGELIDYPINIIRFSQPSLNTKYIIKFTPDLTLLEKQKVFISEGEIMNGC